VKNKIFLKLKELLGMKKLLALVMIVLQRKIQGLRMLFLFRKFQRRCYTVESGVADKRG